MNKVILLFLGVSIIVAESAVGAEWQIVTSPNGINPVNELHGVSVVSETDVWAVGVSYNTERSLSTTLIEHWNGVQWSVVPSPNPSSTLNILSAVAAVSTNDVWAVGFAPTSSTSVVIMHWNGTTWSVVPNPTSAMTLTGLAALAVISTNDIWAVGSGRIGDEDATALERLELEHCAEPERESRSR